MSVSWIHGTFSFCPILRVSKAQPFESHQFTRIPFKHLFGFFSYKTTYKVCTTLFPPSLSALFTVRVCLSSIMFSLISICVYIVLFNTFLSLSFFSFHSFSQFFLSFCFRFTTFFLSLCLTPFLSVCVAGRQWTYTDQSSFFFKNAFQRKTQIFLFPPQSQASVRYDHRKSASCRCRRRWCYCCCCDLKKSFLVLRKRDLICEQLIVSLF